MKMLRVLDFIACIWYLTFFLSFHFHSFHGIRYIAVYVSLVFNMFWEYPELGLLLRLACMCVGSEVITAV
jgi:hypothetical protein